MAEWMQEPAFLAVVLIVISVLGLVGGSFSSAGVTLNVQTTKGKVNIFIMAIGVIGLAMLLFDFFYFLER
jgi:hypothetical protein